MSINNTKNISTIHQAVNGTYVALGKCFNSEYDVTITDATGSIEGKGNIKCHGTYGKARIKRQGNNTSIVSFKPIKVIKADPIKVSKWVTKTHAMINTPDGDRLVKVSHVNGQSDYLLLTSRGYEQL